MSFSNILSNFGSSIPYNLISLASDAIEVSVANAYAYSFYARYICVGNVLIQFSDASNGTTEFKTGSGSSIDFPIPYDTNPYIVMIETLNANGDVILNLNGWTNTTINFNITADQQYPDVTFIAIGPIPQMFNLYQMYQTTYTSNATVTPYINTYSGITYYGLIIETTNNPGDDSGSVVLNFTNNISNINMLVVGGGGGGGSYATYGDGVDTITNYYSGGGGGGGASFYVNSSTSNINIKPFTPINIVIGTGGLGCNKSTATAPYAGTNGLTSSLSFTDTYNNAITLTAGGGAGGNLNTSYGGGGNGGSTTSTPQSSVQLVNYANYGGGGGGGGGGAMSGGNHPIGGDGGANDLSNNKGDDGVNGNNFASGTTYGGDGGNSFIYNNASGIIIPFYTYQTDMYIGGGGGAGSINDVSTSTSQSGGYAGNGKGGGSYNLTTNDGQNASYQLPTSSLYGYYGGGGGGGGSYYDNNIFNYGNGGNGSNGVVMLWWQQP